MTNYFKWVEADIESAIKILQGRGVLPAALEGVSVTVEPPKDPAHGDVATNAALVLARQAGQKPRELAALIADELARTGDVLNAEVAGPGFINLRLSPEFWGDRLRDILALGIAYGESELGRGTRVNVEFVSANPTGPMHVGHGRGAVFGDVLARLLAKAGFEVTREYYVNDAGAQVDQLARSAFLRYREALGEEIGEIPEGLYPGDYLRPVGRDLADLDGRKWLEAPEADWLPVFRQYAVESMLALIREDLAGLGIHFDLFSSERALVEGGAVDRAMARLDEKGLLYTGVLEPPKGKLPDDWEERPQTLFRATDFGDDVDRPIRKSDGSWTYFAGDIAYHHDKIERGFSEIIDVWGADHGGYVKRVAAAMKALAGGNARLDVKLCQLVKILEGGEPVKMSKRAGNFVLLRDVVDAVGKDVVRFIMLTRRNDQALDFDLKKVTEQSRENPVFYVQYAHARICSVLRLAAGETPDLDLSAPGLTAAALERLTAPAEVDLVRLLAAWPRLVEGAAESHEPHRIAYYLQEVAAAFHGLWNMGKTDATLRFLNTDDGALTHARLALLSATRLVVASGLDVLGVTPVEEM
ncbi:MAG: arginine--tRNA ligase [Alphaproteobacteria bacterium]